MGDHVHKKGEWMYSYRYMQMEMDGLLKGSSSLSASEVHKDFMVSPTDMTMSMHMVGVMRATSDRSTWMLMLPYINQSMNHQMRNGRSFETSSDGLGDIKLSNLYVLKKWYRSQIHLNMGLSFPTGSTDERGDTPMGSNQKLPYPMQLGSGTWDILPGLTYLGQRPKWSWGAQWTSRMSTGKNDENYQLGDRHQWQGWISRMWNDTFSNSLRLSHERWGNIEGADADLNPNMVPTARTDLRGGSKTDISFGLNYYCRSGTLKGNRLALDFTLPIQQNLDGPQLETDWVVMIGWQLAR